MGSLPAQENQMQKQNLAISFYLPLSDQKNKKPSMASKDIAPQCRRGGGDTYANNSASDSEVPEDFEFCIPASGGLVPDRVDAADMCVAGEVFSGGKLLPLRLSSATAADVSALLLFRSDSLDGATTVASTSDFSSRSDSRSASSSSSRSSSVSRSASLKSEFTEPIGRSHSSKSASSDAVAPPRRSVTNSVFYAHPSPSPRPPRRSGGSVATSAARRSTGSAPPAAWGVIRLGVVGAPEVYAPRETESRKVARGGSRSARFEQPRPAGKEPVATVDKKLALGLLGAGLVCSCSADAVEPVSFREAASAAARRRRGKAEVTKKGDVKSGRSTVRRSRILDWLEELSIAKPKNSVPK